jgi:hypothetical protein
LHTTGSRYWCRGSVATDADGTFFTTMPYEPAHLLVIAVLTGFLSATAVGW